MSAESWTSWAGVPLNPAGDEIRRQELIATQTRQHAEAVARRAAGLAERDQLDERGAS